MPKRAAALTLALTLAIAPAGAQVRPADGDWLGFATTAILMGLVIPVVEHLHIDGDRIQQRGWTVPMTDAPCTAAPAECPPPVTLGAGRLEAAGEALRVVAEGPQTNPYDHPTDAARWNLIALAGHDWAVRGGDTMMILSRPATAEGEPVTLERVYVRAPADAAGWLFDYLLAAELSVGRSVCGVMALQDAPLDWARFLDLIAAMAPVTAEIRHLSRPPGAGRTARLRYLTLLRGPAVLGDRAADVSDVPEGARSAWLAHHAWLAAGAEPEPGLHLVEPLGFQADQGSAERARACEEYFFSF